VELAGYVQHSALSPDSNDGEFVLLSHEEISKQAPFSGTSPISPTSPAYTRSPRAQAYSQAAGMPFAALVRRLSYTSSRLPAKYANRQYRENAHKRPKTSSGPLLSLSHQQGLAVETDETPIKTITGEHSGASLAGNNGSRDTSGKITQHNIRPGVSSTRPTSRRRTKSGEAVLASPKGSVKVKGKGHKRPGHPLRSISFMDEVLLKTPGSHKRNKPNSKLAGNITAPISPVTLADKDQNARPLSPIPAHVVQPEAVSVITRETTTPMTPDHEIEAQLAKHDFKRLSMPNLPTPPPTSHCEHPGSLTAGYSPMSIGLRTPSRAGSHGEAQIVKVSSRRGSSDERRDTKSFTPGWPWHRRNSNSSLTSLLSPRLGRQVSPSLSPSSVPAISPSNVSANNGPLQGQDLPVPVCDSLNLAPPVDPPSPKLDGTTSPIAPLRTSPLSASTISSPATPDSAVRGRGGKRPGSGGPRRSLSASFVNLGRKVASLGNNQAFEVGWEISGLSSSAGSRISGISGSSEGNRSSSNPVTRDAGVFPSPSPKTGIKGKEWPWRRDSHVHSSPASPLSSASSPHDDTQWSFKVHAAHPVASPAATSSPSPTAQGKTLYAPRAHSPVFARSPLGADAVQGDTYITPVDTVESPRSSLALSRDPKIHTPQAGIPPAHGVTSDSSKASNLATEEGVYSTMRTKSDLLSPDRASESAMMERSFVVDSRPKLYRNARSDDGGLAAHLNTSLELSASIESLSTSAPAPGRQGSFLMSGFRSPTRQASPSPSRNLTKIPEADEQDLQTRRESWLASLRGKPAAGKRRMSAADIFGLPPPTSPRNNAAVEPPTPTIDSEIPAKTILATEGLDFSKKVLVSTALLGGQLTDAKLPSPSTPPTLAQPIRSRAVSQSSLLSASRPVTPGTSKATASSDAFPPFSPALMSLAHRYTRSMPAVPQLDHTSMQPSGLGAPESSVLNASQAKFARALGPAGGSQPPTTPAPVSTPASKTNVREDLGRQDQGNLTRVMSKPEDSEHALDSDEIHEHEPRSRHLLEDQVLSPEMHRTPKLSYATSSSADSHPSTMEPRTGIRARILDMGTPVRAGSGLHDGSPQAVQELVFHRSSPSNRTSSSMSNSNGPKNAFDILLSSKGLDSIDGMPQSRVAMWARRDGSDDSEITITSTASDDDGRPRDVFDEGRVSVW